MSATEAVATVATTGMESVDEMKSVRFQCEKAGFKRGAHVVRKATQHSGVFKIENIDDTHAEMFEINNGEIDPGSEVKVCVEVLMAEWRLHKCKVVAKLEATSLASIVIYPNGFWLFPIGCCKSIDHPGYVQLPQAYGQCLAID